MIDRRPARDQELPEPLVLDLRSLQKTALYERCRDLYALGWPLRAIGEALIPVRPRSTIRSWIQKVDPLPTAPIPSTPIETPTLRTPPAYVPRKPKSPGISKIEQDNIDMLAPIARRYRSGMDPRHSASQANQEFTELVQDLYDRGVPVQELADSARVTYRAMARRIKNREE